MVLPSAGNPISFDDLKTEFGGSTPIPLNDYYKSFDGTKTVPVGPIPINSSIPFSINPDVSLYNYYGGSAAMENPVITSGNAGTAYGYVSGTTGSIDDADMSYIYPNATSPVLTWLYFNDQTSNYYFRLKIQASSGTIDNDGWGGIVLDSGHTLVRTDAGFASGASTGTWTWDDGGNYDTGDNVFYGGATVTAWFYY